MRVIVALTGASGIIVGFRLAQELAAAGHEVVGIMTRAAWHVAAHEAPHARWPDGVALFDEHDLSAPLNSSSYLFDAMAVVPCTMNTLAALAMGHSATVVVRAADIALRTNRKLILAPRETPLPASALRNMLRLRQEGAVIAPLMAAYYHLPRTADDMTAFLTGKLLDLLGVPHHLFRRWEERDTGAGPVEV